MIISTLRLFPPREQRRQLLGLLRSTQGPTQAQPHCLNCRLYEEDGYDASVLYVEEWDSESDFQRHVRSDLYRRILEALELSRTSPEVHFRYIESTRGMELIETLRGERADTELI